MLADPTILKKVLRTGCLKNQRKSEERGNSDVTIHILEV